MKAAVLHGVRDLRLEEVPTPEPADNEVLVRVVAAGLCGTDVHMWDGTNQEGTFPFIPGHEWAGEVVEVGTSIKGFAGPTIKEERVTTLPRWSFRTVVMRSWSARPGPVTCLSPIPWTAHGNISARLRSPKMNSAAWDACPT